MTHTAQELTAAADEAVASMAKAPFAFNTPEGAAGDYSVSATEVEWINIARTTLPLLAAALGEALRRQAEAERVLRLALSSHSYCPRCGVDANESHDEQCGYGMALATLSAPYGGEQ